MVIKRIAIYHLETLQWIARLGTFRAAAERLNTTQPAISSRVREIEEQLGVALFQRQGRRMVLTARGRQLVQACEPLWTSLERVLLAASDFAGATGTVRMATGEIAAASCLPAFLAEIERDLPGLTMEVELDLTARMLQQLLAGSADLVLLAGPVVSPGIRTAPIGSIDLIWVSRRSAHLEEGVPIWSLPSHSPLHAVTIQSLVENGLSSRQLNTCNNLQTLIGILYAGRGAAVLPETMVRDDLRSGRLVEIPPPPKRWIGFEVAVREAEREPLVLELFRRATMLKVDADLAG